MSYQIKKYNTIKPHNPEYIKTGFSCIDQPMNGGLPIGAAILFSGTPGAGKSTLATQIMQNIKKKTLYIAGEEAPERIKKRIERLGGAENNLHFYTERPPTVQNITEAIEKHDYELLIVDSIQKITDAESKSSTVVNGIKKLYSHLQENRKYSILAIAQSTKKGNTRGSQEIMHEFDAVGRLSQNEKSRVFTWDKNREGEIGEAFQLYMTNKGLSETREQATPDTDEDFTSPIFSNGNLFYILIFLILLILS